MLTQSAFFALLKNFSEPTYVISLWTKLTIINLHTFCSGFFTSLIAILECCKETDFICFIYCWVHIWLPKSGNSWICKTKKFLFLYILLLMELNLCLYFLLHCWFLVFSLRLWAILCDKCVHFQEHYECWGLLRLNVVITYVILQSM